VRSPRFLQLMEEFHVLVKQIGSLPVKVQFSMVQLDCEELNRGLADKAKSYSDTLLEKMIASHREQNIQWVASCDIFREIYCHVSVFSLSHTSSRVCFEGSALNLKPSERTF